VPGCEVCLVDHDPPPQYNLHVCCYPDEPNPPAGRITNEFCNMADRCCKHECTTTTTTTTSITLDPHLFFAHGGRADFKGEDGKIYNVLSARNVSFNALFEHADFNNPHRVVHGSFMKAAYFVVRTALTGRLLHIDYTASASPSLRARVRERGLPDVWLSHGGDRAQFTVENVVISMEEKKIADKWHGIALTINTGRWQLSVWSKPFPNAKANPGKALLNMKVEALYDADHDIVAPHGLIGQSYDGDDKAVDGALDDYRGKEVTTKAMAEGAIEGHHSDYELAAPFATEFRFSRFDALKAHSRDVSKLSGKKWTNKQAGAARAAGSSEDVEDEPQKAAA